MAWEKVRAGALSVYVALGVERALRNHMHGSAAEYNLNAVLRLLVCKRICTTKTARISRLFDAIVRCQANVAQVISAYHAT